MSQMTTRGTFSQVIDASIRALYDQGKLDLSSSLYGPSLCFTEYEPDVPDDKISSLSGPGYGRLTVEGQQYGSNQLYRGYPVTLVMNKFTSELSWTEEDLHWIQKLPSSKRATDFNNVVKHAVNALNGNLNLEAAKLFYLAFTTTNLTGGDGKALVAGDHTIRKTGLTQSNQFPTGDTQRSFGSAALTDAISIVSRFKGMNDVQMLPSKRLRIFCSIELFPTVDQVLTSLYGPTNANLGLQTGSKEAIKRRGMDIEAVVIPDIPYAYRNYWFLIDLDRAAEMAWFANGWMPRMSETTEYRKGTYYNDSSTFFGYVFSGWQWIFASKGDNTAI